ncbi:hypothetical protein FB451DRAFT_1399725 [Mycena latifolia]|nr:hypothetical protein FB451DRAFT_1399725 [Mycena latifolia]
MHDGDRLTMLNVYNGYVNNQRDKNWMWPHFLSARALAQVINIRTQLERMMERCGRLYGLGRVFR